MPFAEPHIGHHPSVEDVTPAGLTNGRGMNSSTRGLSIPDRVALIYYKHGLLCSSYPWCTIVVAIIIVLTSCHPLLSLPFPGNEPEEISFPLPEKGISADHEFGKIYQYPTRWGIQKPSFYVQQIVVRSSVNPWTSDLGLMDAFRGPLGEVFKIHSEVVAFHSPRSNLTLREVCLYVEGAAPSARSFQHLLPEFNCLILSPANLWRLDETKFRDDAQFLDTIFSYKNPMVEVRSSMADILFGVPLKNSGLKKYPVKTRSRVLTFALTIILKTPSEPLLADLRSRLQSHFPLHSSTHESSSMAARRQIVHIYYPERSNYLELIPLTFVYVMLFFYIYFSVRKIEMVKSKLGMAFSAVVTVVASLGMSVGLCTWFGLRFTLQGRDIFPYLVVIVGLENILVLTRSVVSTPANLDVKIRVAQGLSREGWNITKNLLTEVTILTVGFFTFVPAIQEFCLFAVVALLSDFVLQMLFFSTVLSIDILRKELSVIQRHRRQLQPGQQYLSTTNQSGPTMSPSSERVYVSNAVHPHLRTRLHTSTVLTKVTPTAVVAPSSYTHSRSAQARVPRRIRIVHFWARTRFFQRSFMVGVVIWMGVFFYKYAVFENFAVHTVGWPAEFNDSSKMEFPSHQPHDNPKVSCSVGANCVQPEELAVPKESAPAKPEASDHSSATRETNEIDWQSRLQHPKNVDLWRRLSHRHWPDLLEIYNISLAGKCIAMLPPIRLSISVHPDRLAEVRNSRDGEYLTRSRWKSLASALDSLDVLDGDDSDGISGTSDSGGQNSGSAGNGGPDEEMNKMPYVPSSPIEIILTTLLAIPSVAFIAYVTVVLYRCICSRHYAEWRSSSTFWGWAGNAGGGLTQESREYYSQIVAESMPLVLDGHRSPIECISTDGDVVSSVCLAGQLHIWDIQTGDAVAQIDRNTYFATLQQQQSPPLTTPASPRSLRYDYYSSTSELANVSSHSVSSPVVFRSTNSFHSPPASPNDLTSWRDRTSPTSNKSYTPSPVWCMQCFDGQVALGCANGRIEIWSHNSGLCCLYDDGSGVGVSKLKVCGDYLLATRLNGALESFQFHPVRPVEDANGHIHSRRGVDHDSENQADNRFPSVVRLVRLNWARAHQQPISVLDASADGSRVVTGSLDHCLKVWRLETLTALYCLHGHRGPITALFIDDAFPCSASVSGSQDGMLCMWDLSSGTCVYSLQAHDGSVSVLTYTSSYVISLGADDKLCVWERFQGHLLNSLSLARLALCSSLAMLNDRLLVTSRQGSLVVWDVRTGESIREVRLGDADSSTFVRHVMVVRDNVICDYGTQLRIVSFPMISTHKVE